MEIHQLQEHVLVTEGTLGLNCSARPPRPFSDKLFTKKQRLSGAIILHFIAIFYMDLAMGIMCYKYTIPAANKLCNVLHMSSDMTGATVLAIMTTAPEFFVNIIATFVTYSDLGYGTIIGSAVFNFFVVPATAGIMISKPLQVDWWIFTRDCIIYGISLAVLIYLVKGHTEWYGAIVLILLYAMYLVLLILDRYLQPCARGPIERRLACLNNLDLPENDIDIEPIPDVPVGVEGNVIFHYPKGEHYFKQVSWIVMWPLRFLFFITIPRYEKSSNQKIFPLTLIMSTVWMGVLTYLATWVLEILGETFSIPESVMALTISASGTGVPELVSSVVLAKKGDATMAVCSSLRANTVDILLTIGVLWLAKAAIGWFTPGKFRLRVYSIGLEYCTISLLAALLLFYIMFKLNKYHLDHRIGYICIVAYLICLTIALLLELNVIFVVVPKTCPFI